MDKPTRIGARGDRRRQATVPVPETLHIVPGLRRDEARRVYRHRMWGAMLVALMSISVLWLAAWSEIRFDIRAFSFQHTFGVVSPGYQGDTPLIVQYEQGGDPGIVELSPGSGTYHVGQVVPIWYDDVCEDVLFGDSDFRSTIIGDIIGVVVLPFMAFPLIGWHARRWRRRVEAVVAAARPSHSSVQPVPSYTRRPLFAVTSGSGPLGQTYYLPLLSRQLARAVRNPTELEVIGEPRNRGIVALREPGSPNVLWPAGRLRRARWTVDHYDVARVGAVVGPQLSALIYHLVTKSHGC